MLIWCRILNVNAEKLLVSLVVLSFALTSLVIFLGPRRLVTREEAIEISRNSESVRSLLEDSDKHYFRVHYMNMTGISDHGMWYINWLIHLIGTGSAAGVVVTHHIDEVTGEILKEGRLELR